MRKLFLCFISLLSCVTIVSAATKLALVGDNNTVDLLTVKLSEDSSLELLERSQIESVLKEHNLNASQFGSGELVKYFPHVDILTIVAGKRLIIFNTKNGFRLGNFVFLSIDDAIKLIHLAIAKKKVKDPVLLSIVSVRDVGIPATLKPKIKEFISNLECKLSDNPKIQFLERSYLEYVQKERDITSRNYKLAASAKLLKFEFEPGSESDKVILRFAAITPNGKELFRGQNDKPFGDEIQGISSVAKLILRQLVIGKNKILKGNEAEQFYQEYVSLAGLGESHYKEAWKKLSAALAFDPDNEKYRFAELKIKKKMLDTLPLEDRIEPLYEQFKLCRKFQKDYPSNSPFCYANLLVNNLPVNSYDRVSPKIRTQLARLCDMVRPLEMKVFKYPCYINPTSNEIGAYRQWLNHSSQIHLMDNLKYYWDYSKWQTIRKHNEIKFIEHTAELVEKDPKFLAKIEEMILRHGHYEILNRFPPNYQWEYDSRIVADLKQTDDYISLAIISPVVNIRVIGLTLKLMHDAVSQPRRKATFKKLLDEYYEKLNEINPEILIDFTSGNYKLIYEYLRKFVDWWMRNPGLERERLETFKKNNSVVSKVSLESLTSMLNKGDFEQLTKNVKSIHTFDETHRETYKHHKFFSKLSSEIFSNDLKGTALPSIRVKLFNALNKQFIINHQTYSKIFGFSRPMIMVGSDADNREIGVILQENGGEKKSKLFVGIMDRNGKKLELIETPMTNSSFDFDFDRLPFFSGWIKMSFSKDYLIFVKSNHKYFRVYVYSRRTKEWQQFKKIPQKRLNSVLFCHGRIFMLVAKKFGTNSDNSLISYRPDGSDYKIHFSTARNIAQNEVDKRSPGEMGSLMKINDNDLLFCSRTRKKDFVIYHYNISNNKFDRFWEINKSLFDRIWLSGSMVLVSSSCCMMSIDIKNKELRPLIATNVYVSKWLNREFPVTIKNLSFGSRSQVINNQFWYVGYVSGLIDMNRPEHNFNLMLPLCKAFYENGKNQMNYLGLTRCFKVKLK